MTLRRSAAGGISTSASCSRRLSAHCHAASARNVGRSTPCALREGRRRGLTHEFEAFALVLMRAMPVKRAGAILGETDQKLWRTLCAHVGAAWADLSWENGRWVGADKMNRKKGHN